MFKQQTSQNTQNHSKQQKIPRKTQSTKEHILYNYKHSIHPFSGIVIVHENDERKWQCATIIGRKTFIDQDSFHCWHGRICARNHIYRYKKVKIRHYTENMEQCCDDKWIFWSWIKNQLHDNVIKLNNNQHFFDCDKILPKSSKSSTSLSKHNTLQKWDYKRTLIFLRNNFMKNANKHIYDKSISKQLWKETKLELVSIILRYDESFYKYNYKYWQKYALQKISDYIELMKKNNQKQNILIDGYIRMNVEPLFCLTTIIIPKEINLLLINFYSLFEYVDKRIPHINEMIYH